MKHVLPKITCFILLAALTAWAGLHGLRLYHASVEKNIIKTEYADINDIKCGLFNVEIWSDAATNILQNKITEFRLGKTNRDLLKKEVENVLNRLLDEAEKTLHEKQEGLGPKLKQAMINAFVDMEKYRKKVPQFAEVIMQEIQKSLDKTEIKNIVKDKLDEYASGVTYDDEYTARQQEILKKYKTTSITECNKILLSRTETLENICQAAGLMVLICIGIVMLGWFAVAYFPYLHGIYFLFTVLVAVVCLLCGLTSPMIEIDARISEMHFTLLNETISFKDQVIFYRSKSILDVVRVLTATGKPDSVAVGVLIIVFSIVFPLTKIICILLLAAITRLKSNKFIHFMVFKSGKWSMADVFVVAIFMAYIGFNGILDDQLDYINMDKESLSLITTNKTALEIGFSLFVAFCIFNLVISEILKRVVWANEHKENPK